LPLDTYSYNSLLLAKAAAFKAAKETAKVALAPKALLLGVLSMLIKALSILL
jgi:hypothetical protein